MQERCWYRPTDTRTFIACKDVISPLLCKLFDHMFDKCVYMYPESWSNGIIVRVPKKVDRRDVNNYRAITQISIFSKKNLAYFG